MTHTPSPISITRTPAPVFSAPTEAWGPRVIRRATLRVAPVSASPFTAAIATAIQRVTAPMVAVAREAWELWRDAVPRAIAAIAAVRDHLARHWPRPRLAPLEHHLAAHAPPVVAHTTRSSRRREGHLRLAGEEAG